MKQCPKCETKHNKPGTFCSRKCANSRTFTKEAKTKKSIANKKYNASVSDTERAALSNKIAKGMLKTSELKIENTDFDLLGSDLQRKKILCEQNYLCDICGILPAWNGMNLKFHLDH